MVIHLAVAGNDAPVVQGMEPIAALWAWRFLVLRRGTALVRQGRCIALAPGATVARR